MKIPHIGGYLKALRKEKHKTLKDVGDAINTSASYVSQLEKGVRNPSDDVLEQILKTAFLMNDSDAEIMLRKWRIEQYQNIAEGAMPDVSFKKEGEVPVIPYFKEIPQNFSSAKADEYWPFFVEDADIAKNLFIWQMKDDSMEPHIPEGAILVIDRDTNNLPYRSVILCRAETKSNVRYLEKRDEKYKLIPANNKYPVYFGENVEVLGKVKKMFINV
ncbi:LexA family transcriptional regulator [Candidatus Peregrinibacteria bacterium]|nr:LexA family transcriptional regulator [Candidatus Peregrinibacteria bacterium]